MTAQHIGELRLRRFRIGELEGEAREEVARHTAACATCRSRLDGLSEEQRAFEEVIPYPRFAGGVERARRVPRVMARRSWLAAGAVGLAAAAGLLMVIRPAPQTRNNLKGGEPQASVRIASADGQQRTALPQERLRPGDRLRFGHHLEVFRHLAVVSVDDAGEVTAIYPERGTSLAVAPSTATVYLGDSVELTGSGRERVFMLLALEPFDVAAAVSGIKQAFAATGDVATMPQPLIADRQSEAFSWVFQKP